MIEAPYSETDLELVVRAGDWCQIADATMEERSLAGACALLEADLREREWAAFETVLPYMVNGWVVVPPDSSPGRKAELLAAVVELSWHRPVPTGAAGWQP